MSEASASSRPSLVQRLVAGEGAALARTISLIEAGGANAGAIHRAIRLHTGKGLVVGFTGPPGAGKSTLIDAYIAELRRAGRTVAVAAVDPSSPFSGGAVLGDRIRMGRHTEDEGVFIRSISSRGHLGGLTENIHRIVDVMDAAGRDVIVVETVGTGQSEVELIEIADVRVVVSAPGLGDDVQAIKAGVLEIADILVLNKADMPMADVTARQLGSMLKLRHRDRQDIPIVQTIATEGRGIADLSAIVDRAAQECARDRPELRRMRTRRLLAQCAAGLVRRQILESDTALLAGLLTKVDAGDIELEHAAVEAVKAMVGTHL